MIATIERKFLGLINEVEFYSHAEFNMAMEILKVLEHRIDNSVLDYDTVASLKEYIGESISRETRLSTIAGCLRVFAKTSDSAEDFVNRLGSTADYKANRS